MSTEDTIFRLFKKCYDSLHYIALFIARIAYNLFGRKQSSSTAQGTKGEKIQVHYSSLEHSKKPNAFTISFSEIPNESDIQIAMKDSLFHDVNIQKITPEPQSIQKKGENTIYTFHTQSTPFSVCFNTLSSSIGCIPLEINIINGPSLHFYKYVCP